MISVSRKELNERLQRERKPKRYNGVNPESEAAIQATFFEWVDRHKTAYPELDLMFSIPNEGNRSGLDGWKRKITGRRSGVPDTCLPVPTFKDGFNLYAALWIEFKSKTGKVSPEQSIWHDKLRKAGHRVEVCRSWVDAANIVIEYLGLDLPKL